MGKRKKKDVQHYPNDVHKDIIIVYNLTLTTTTTTKIHQSIHLSIQMNLAHLCQSNGSLSEPTHIPLSLQKTRHVGAKAERPLPTTCDQTSENGRTTDEYACICQSAPIVQRKWIWGTADRRRSSDQRELLQDAGSAHPPLESHCPPPHPTHTHTPRLLPH